MLDMQRLAGAIRHPHAALLPRHEGDEESGAEDEEGGAEEVAPQPTARTARFMSRYRQLNERLADIVEDYNLVAFVPVTIKEPTTLVAALRMIDKSHGFVPARGAAADASFLSRDTSEWDADERAALAERFTSRHAE